MYRLRFQLTNFSAPFFTLMRAVQVLVAVCAVTLSVPASANGGSGGRINVNDPGIVRHVRLTINKSQTLRVSRPFSEALIASPKIADVVPLTDQSVYIVGKEVGLTRLTLVDPEKSLIGVIEIEVSYDVQGLREELVRSIPDGNFNIRTANGRILLAGSVPDAIALSKASDITGQFTASCVAAAAGELTQAIGATPVGPVGPGGVGASAAVGPAGAGLGVGAATNLAGVVPPSAEKTKCFVNMLAVRAPQQVMLEVRFVEAQRNAGRDLGLSWDGSANRFRGITGGVSSSSTISPTVDPNTMNDFGNVELTSPGALAAGALLTGLPSTAVPFGTFVARILHNGFSADAVIQALEKRGIARRLAEPNLVTLSGDTANFLAGGEFPIPVAADRDRITIEFKKFGVGLAFTPTVLADGQINLKIEPEVSDLDPNNTILVAGTRIPSLVVRRARTTVELRDGQSFAIAGLLESKHTKNTRELPWLGTVPVLGALFRSASYEKNDSDLVIIVTPRLVRPATPGQPLATPLDQRLPGNDKDYFVGGRLEVPKHFDGPYGHILDISQSVAALRPSETGHVPSK